MEARRARRREKKKQRMARQENIPCIVFLATDEESFELAEKKEDRQLRYINQYADAHGLIPMKIVRKSCFAPYGVNQMYSRCIDWKQQGKAEAILVANMEYLALDEEDAYRKVGQVRKAGFRIFSVDDGELKLIKCREFEEYLSEQIEIYDFTFPPFYAMIKFEFCGSFIKK